MMDVQVIQVPYDSGHRGVRMGAGPEHFVRNGMERMLADEGHDVRVECVEAASSFRAEIKTTVELCRLLAGRVGEARRAGRFPLVLSGNCNASLGTLAGVRAREDTGMIWFDAHGDFNTPETRESSFFDGMGMAVATGHCWRKLAATIPGFSPLADSSVVHVGGRDFDPEEEELLQTSGVGLVSAARIRQAGARTALSENLKILRGRVRKIYLHIDLDVLDPKETPANVYAPRVPDGLFVEQVEEAVRLIGEHFIVCACGIASYDPLYDESGRTFQAGVRIMKTVLANIASTP